METTVIRGLYRSLHWVSLIVIHLCFSYYLFDGWWYSAIGTLLMVLVGWLLWRDRAWETLGLKLSPRSLAISIALAVLLIPLELAFMDAIAQAQGIVIHLAPVGHYVHDIFYCLNEEILLGAVLLNSLRKALKWHSLWISCQVALAFSLLHFAFYQWIFAAKGTLIFATLASLLFVGIVRNNTILSTGHIGFAWALHFSWMAVMFGNYHWYGNTGNFVSEVERFNLYLGAPVIVGLSAVLAGLSAVPLIKHVPFGGKGHNHSI